MADPRKLKDPAVGLAEFTALMSAISPEATLPRNGGAEEWWSDDPSLNASGGTLPACSLVQACRAYATAAGEFKGVWGATTPAQRRSTRRRSAA
jgi:hypothetical protein